MRLFPLLALVLCPLPASPGTTVHLAAGGTRPAVPFLAAGQRLQWPGGKVTLRLSRSLRGETGGVAAEEDEAAAHAALAAAARAWSASPYASVTIETEPSDDARADLARNTVVFTDPAPFDDGRCDRRTAAACTLLSYIVETGEIQGAAIAFNPYLRFSSIGIAGTIDLAAVMLHEVGHVLGLDHSALLNASMGPFVESLVGSTPAAFSLRELSADDLLSLAETYPAADAVSRLGRISGIARLDGVPLEGGHVVAVAEDGAPVRDVLTDAEGRFAMAVEPGLYALAIEPLDGPVAIARFAQPPERAPTFPTVFWTAAGGDSLRPETLRVEAGVAATADFAIAAGEISNLRRVGIVESGATAYLFQVDLPRGGEYLLSAIRDPLTGSPALRISGGELQLKGPTVRGPDPDLAEQAVVVPAGARLGSRNLYFHNGTGGSMLAGALRVTLRPRVSSVRISSDGQAVVITGEDLAASSSEPGGATQAGGVSVRVGDRFAPLTAVSPQEIRAAIPAGAPAGRTEVVVVAGAAVRSAPQTVELPAR